LITIIGHIRSGLGKASGFLVHQLPHIEKEFSEVAACRRGSINVELDVPLLVLVPDHRTKPIAWMPGSPFKEVFDLLRIELEAPPDAPPLPAWLYIPHGSPHRRTLKIHEIITTPLDLTGVKSCRIKIKRSTFQLPWHQYPIVVVT
jgi:hypothetical protein